MAAKHSSGTHPDPGPLAIFRDLRFIQIALQIIFVVIVVFALALLWSSILQTLGERNLAPTFGFLDSRAGFDIGEKPDWYSSNSTYGEALLVGAINTLRVVGIGLVLSTILGVLFGIFLLSSNWLIRTLSRIYVEVLRNTPLLVQLIFWYYVVMFGLPLQDVTIPNEGIYTIPMRFPVYIVIFALVWAASRRAHMPSRITSSAFVMALLMEVSFAFGGFNQFLLIWSAVGGFVFIVSWFVPGEWRRPMQAVALVPLAQLVIHLIFHILSLLGLLMDSQRLIVEITPSIYMSRTGFVFPQFLVGGRFVGWMAFVLLGLVSATGIWYYGGHVTETTGRPIARGWYGIIVFLAFTIIGWSIVTAQPAPTQIPVAAEGEQPVYVDRESTLSQLYNDGEYESWLQLRQEFNAEPLIIAQPEKSRFRFEVGSYISPEYMALLLGLVIYTSAFIAEIVRAGIQAVPYGQIEAARALGLSGTQTLTRIVLPQALRVIIPPMGNQYLNLSKNSSLAVAIAYADTYQVGTTIMNQSGQSVTGFTLVLLIYLTLSLVISAGMNFVNTRFQLVTR